MEATKSIVRNCSVEKSRFCENRLWKSLTEEDVWFSIPFLMSCGINMSLSGRERETFSIPLGAVFYLMRSAKNRVFWWQNYQKSVGKHFYSWRRRIRALWNLRFHRSNYLFFSKDVKEEVPSRFDRYIEEKMDEGHMCQYYVTDVWLTLTCMPISDNFNIVLGLSIERFRRDWISAR